MTLYVCVCVYIFFFSSFLCVKMEKNPPPLSKPFNNQRIIDSTTPFPLIVLLFPLRPPVLCLPVYVSDFLTYLSTLPKAIHLFFSLFLLPSLSHN